MKNELRNTDELNAKKECGHFAPARSCHARITIKNVGRDALRCGTSPSARDASRCGTSPSARDAPKKRRGCTSSLFWCGRQELNLKKIGIITPISQYIVVLCKKPTKYCVVNSFHTGISGGIWGESYHFSSFCASSKRYLSRFPV